MSQKLIITTQEELSDIVKESVSSLFEKVKEAFLSNSNDSSNHKSNLIYIEEASELTGLALSTIRKKCHYGEMNYNKPKGTKRLVFRRDELIAWMDSGRHDMRSETANENMLVLKPKNRK
jgi:excisionase family DNA binding protein